MPDANRAATSLAAKLARALQELAKGLTLPSESDFPYKAFSAEISKTTTLTAESFRAAVGIGRRFKLVMDPAEQFFQLFRDPQNNDPGEVKTYALLERVMKATLSDLQTVRVRGEGVVRVRFYVFGRMEKGSLVGLSSISIET